MATDPLAGLRSAIDRFDPVVTARLRAVAWRKSREVKAIASQHAARSGANRSHLNEGHPHIGDSIVIIEEPEKKRFLVLPETPWNPNLGDWLERGTVRMSAHPFMRPASDQIEASYRAEMIETAKDAAAEVLG